MAHVIKTKEDFDRMLVDNLRKNPFLSTVSRYIRKLPTDSIPTCAVGYDKVADDITLYYSLKFLSGLTGEESEGVLYHELYHVVWQHITRRARAPELMRLWNIATDLAINSIIINDNRGKLPDMCFFPGVRPKMAAGGKMKALRTDPKTGQVEEYERELTEEEKALNDSFADLIASFPQGQASDWYFMKLQEWNNKNGSPMTGKTIIIDANSMDDHGKWGDIPENMRDIVRGKIGNILERAVQQADSQSDGWGNIPMEIREEIRRSVRGQVDWKKVLRNFVGKLNRGERMTTFKRINKRYPYQHPGTKRKYLPKVLIAVDQSGSVGDDDIARIFVALTALSKKVAFTVVNFDTEIDHNSLTEWRKGRKHPIRRTRCGGTDFDAINRWLVSGKRRGGYDGIIIATDGCAPKPHSLPYGMKRAWIIVPNQKLIFDTDELVVTMNNAKDERCGR